MKYNCQDCGKEFNNEIPMFYCDSCKGIVNKNNEGWISIIDKLPKIDQEVEVRYHNKITNDYVIEKSIFSNNCKNNYYFAWVGISNIEDWRPIQEKRHDYSTSDFTEVKCIKCNENYGIVYGYLTNQVKGFLDSLCVECRIKRPDFGKLNRGDIVIIQYRHGTSSDDFYPITFESMNDNSIFTRNSGNHVKKHIKKITRINIEEKTFEEI